MGKIDPAAASKGQGSRYPAPYDQPCRNRTWQRLGEVAGLTQFGVNRLRLPPGTWSSQRHWHSAEDEFVYLLEGEVVLVTDAGEQTLRAGECAGFKAGVRDGHHAINRSSKDAVLLVVGSRNEADFGEYPDIDLKFPRKDAAGRSEYQHKDGKPY
jgi:uncharacterized cupin superfamily protein